jgi:hypothetical protein
VTDVVGFLKEDLSEFRAIKRLAGWTYFSFRNSLEHLMSYKTCLRRRAAAEYLREQRGIPCSEKTLAKLACVGGGPVYRLFGRIPLYTSLDLDAYADSKLGKPVRSTSEYGYER